MSPNKIPLDLISVASPCTASWDAMKGDERTRFCAQCSLHVYNLSDLTQEQAETLVMEHEGKLCIRYFQRFDGTVLTKDCPIGWRAIKKNIAFAGTVAAAFVVMIFGVFTAGAFAGAIRGNVQGGGPAFRNPIQLIRDWFSPPQIAGGICVPPPPPPAPPAPPAPQEDAK